MLPSQKPQPLAVSLALSSFWLPTAAQAETDILTSDTPMMTVVAVGSQPLDGEPGSVTLDAADLLPLRAAASLLRDVPGDSIGGTLIVESAKPQFAKAGVGLLTTGEIGALYQSNGNAMGVDADAPVANENLSLTYTASAAQSHSYTAGGDFKTSTATGRLGHRLPLDEVGSTTYESINQAPDIAYHNENHRFDLKQGHQNIPYENFPNQRMDMTDNKSSLASLSYTGDYQWGA
ncbi:MAG TPA: hypothetical protein PLE48_00185 [Thiobacillus sp.]|nr:MAG: hypothetical protein B7Y50_05420 [Hydrogenophilales bacterium 28-61-11]OYZ56255.1 MAG: hypothetical protein B7Y21_12260 [Hydrogenophilales bacterium 16-61-112]OZA43385.1 MAG: hypothetical protein B7X81_11365 [Hydrogenophilales bacterium 17-61-76]HQT31117.1 hypothetical protein [Thiobacillus sp.]HQT68826.1 hypothetical protein [Thiobacillus sp.]